MFVVYRQNPRAGDICVIRSRSPPRPSSRRDSLKITILRKRLRSEAVSNSIQITPGSSSSQELAVSIPSLQRAARRGANPASTAICRPEGWSTLVWRWSGFISSGLRIIRGVAITQRVGRRRSAGPPWKGEDHRGSGLSGWPRILSSASAAAAWTEGASSWRASARGPAALESPIRQRAMAAFRRTCS